MKLSLGALGAIALLVGLSSAAQAQGHSCMLDTRKALEATIAGLPMSKEILESMKGEPEQTCYEYGGALSTEDLKDALESCQTISGTRVAKCSPDYKAACQGIYGKPVNIYYYGASASTFGTHKAACLNPPANDGEGEATPGKWIEK